MVTFYRWRREDAEVACRQMGWSGGAWRGWVERSAAPLSRLLLLPNCAGTELTLSECFHAPIQMGGPTCGMTYNSFSNISY